METEGEAGAGEATESETEAGGGLVPKQESKVTRKIDLRFLRIKIHQI